MQKIPYRETTIETTVKTVKALARVANPDDVEAIKQALRGAKKVKKTRGTTIKIYAIGSPRYRLEVKSKEITDAQATLNLAIEEVLDAIKGLGGEGRKAA
jgi:translation initiation factor 2 alpha subunit (eIF-2alpha)